ncbi:MAG: flippase-like domain-containing protein [Proteobacteria bacterium]|nr:flippase-like domain-containing protein [Pseudomonadota bacterium]
MKIGVYLGVPFGLALAIALIVFNDAASVFDIFARVGFGLVPVVAVRASIIAVCAGAWAVLLLDLRGLPLGVWPLLRWIREGINVLLPVATVGGEIIGARLLTFWGVAAGVAGAGILIDVLLQASGQAVFALIGVALLAGVAGAEELTEWALAGTGVAFLALAGFFAALRFGGVGAIERFVVAQAARWSKSGSKRAFSINPLRLAEALGTIWRRPAALGVSLLLHIAAWLMGVLEIWIALYWMGHDASFAQALILESLGQALRGAAFPVPGALGVQEGGFILLGQLLGIDPQTAIALSLVKRVPEIVLGLPALYVWHRLEARLTRSLPPLYRIAGESTTLAND